MPGIRGTLHEFKAGTLHSGSKKGPIVKSRAQAIAIGLDEERRAGRYVKPKPKPKRRFRFKGKR
jgi:hypothetical protein